MILSILIDCSGSELEESYPQQYPFVAVLRSSNMRCMGALISHSTVLTVSQCLNVVEMEVTLGAFDLTHRNQLERGRIRFYVHADAFRFDPKGLMAAIRFTPLAMLNNFVNIIRVSFSTANENHVNVEAGVAMGFLREPLKDDSMHSISISILNSNNSSSCSSNHANASDLICSQASSVCNLNIGAPLITHNDHGDAELIGLFSFPEHECDLLQPSGFIKINQFLRFIVTNM